MGKINTIKNPDSGSKSLAPYSDSVYVEADKVPSDIFDGGG